jgi:hypothetical protein
MVNPLNPTGTLSIPERRGIKRYVNRARIKILLDRQQPVHYCEVGNGDTGVRRSVALGSTTEKPR